MAHVTGSIRTKYLGPAGGKGSRISAKHLATGRRILMPYNSRYDGINNHFNAAVECYDKVRKENIEMYGTDFNQTVSDLGVDGGSYYYWPIISAEKDK